MEKRQLGKTGISIMPIVFGGNVFGWTIDEAQSFKILDQFTELGFDMIDTADVYSRWAPGNKGGESETIIGKWMKDKDNRNEVIISTKVGSDMGEGKNITRDYIIKEAEASLQRLQTDYIDLYFTHFDVETTPVEETLEAYAQLVSQGKVRHIGASNLSAARIEESLKTSKEKSFPGYMVIQPEYNLYDREKFEKEYESIALKEGLGVISYFSLASGFLTGKYRSKEDFGKSQRGGGMEKYMNERGNRILKALDELTAKYSVSAAGVSLAWLLHKPAITAPIVSATKASQMDAFTEGASLQLTKEDMQLLDEASAI